MSRFWTFSHSCFSFIKITIIDGTLTEVTESDSDEYTYHPDIETDDESSMMLVSTALVNTSTHLFVVKCVPFTPVEKVDWRRTVTFHTFTKIGDKSCKVIVDSESFINAISSRLCENLGLEIIPTSTHSKCLGLISQYLRSNNDVLSQSVSIIIKTRFGVM